MKVFYSWQSDLNHESHMLFIRKALGEAVAKVGADLELEEAERPVLEEASTGRTGAENIVADILKKIANAAIYVADITPIAVTAKDKLLPNPNVLYELGWATAKIDYTRVIMVMNVAEGYRPKDMPFDICQRPIITYQIKPGTTPERRKKVFDRLVEELAVAIAANIKEAIEAKAADIAVKGAPASPKDFSIWDGQNTSLRIPDSFGRMKTTNIAQGGRAYARVIPAAWPEGLPSIHAIERHPIHVSAPMGGSSGTSGACECGFARFWFDHVPRQAELNRDTPATTSNLSMYLEEHGEYWILNGTAVGVYETGTWLHTLQALKTWFNALREANQLFDDLGATKLRRVEFGLMGLGNAKLPTNDQFVRPESRKSHMRIDRQLPVWNKEVQQSFLHDAYNKTLNVFAQPPLTIEQFLAILNKL